MQLIVNITAAGIEGSQDDRHAGRFAGLVLPAREGEIVEMEGCRIYADFTCQVKSA